VNKLFCPLLQRGQASILVILFLLILLVAGLSLFKVGKLTINKMEMQNAADAVAFSMSTVEARDLNFAAYMNRAIVANEVAIGQMVGLASWGKHIKSVADYIDTYDKFVLAPATLGASTGPVTSFSGLWRGAATPLSRILASIAKAGTMVIHNINKIYGGASSGFHIVSLIGALGTIDEVIEKNSPNNAGYKVSTYGMLAITAHVLSYGVLPKVLGVPGQFSTIYTPDEKMKYADYKKSESGYARLSALIRDSGDPWSKTRGWEVCVICVDIDASVGPERFVLTPFLSRNFIGYTEIAFELSFDMDLEIILGKFGGSELRLVLPKNANSKIAAGKAFNWSATDTTDLEMKLFMEMAGSLEATMLMFPEICVPLTGLCTPELRPSVGADVTATGDIRDNELELKMEGCFSAIIDLGCITLWGLPSPGGMILSPVELKLPVPTIAPFSSGFAEAGTKKSINNLDLGHMENEGTTVTPQVGLFDVVDGPVKIERFEDTRDSLRTNNPQDVHYGGAGKGTLAWHSPGPRVPPVGVRNMSIEPFQTIEKTLISDKYTGLPYYVDTTGNDSLAELTAPNIIIALIQDEDDFKNESAFPKPTGRLALNDELADDKLSVMAKSQLYFKRPNDVAHFLRKDGLTEYSNAFNPYWQARLIETTFADRALALVIESKQSGFVMPPITLAFRSLSTMLDPFN
jgi:hypothetical protein